MTTSLSTQIYISYIIEKNLITFTKFGYLRLKYLHRNVGSLVLDWRGGFSEESEVADATPQCNLLHCTTAEWVGTEHCAGCLCCLTFALD